MSASEWRLQDRPTIGIGTSGEQIARATALQIMNSLDERCARLDRQWLTRDQDWASMVGRRFRPLRIDRVPRERVYVGAQPSLIESRYDLWPAITVRCDARGPSEVPEQPDQFDSWDVDLVVEVLVRVGPFEGDVTAEREPSDVVYSQLERLTDAVIACVDLDRTLGGNVLPIKLPPRWNPSLPFSRPLERGAGPSLVFQGCELTWVCTALVI